MWPWDVRPLPFQGRLVRWPWLFAPGVWGELLFRINPQVKVDRLAIVELAYRLGIAFLVFVQRVHFVVDVRRQLRKVIHSIGTDDVALDRSRPRIRQIND